MITPNLHLRDSSQIQEVHLLYFFDLDAISQILLFQENRLLLNSSFHEHTVDEALMLLYDILLIRQRDRYLDFSSLIKSLIIEDFPTPD